MLSNCILWRYTTCSFGFSGWRVACVGDVSRWIGGSQSCKRPSVEAARHTARVTIQLTKKNSCSKVPCSQISIFKGSKFEAFQFWSYQIGVVFQASRTRPGDSSKELSTICFPFTIQAWHSKSKSLRLANILVVGENMAVFRMFEDLSIEDSRFYCFFSVATWVGIANPLLGRFPKLN